MQKGITELRDAGNVPDVYTQNMLLENENKILKKDLKHYKQAAEYVIFLNNIFFFFFWTK